MPVAYWCILAAAIMPLVLVGYAKSGSRDNNAPRDSAERLEGRKRRAYAAHQNGFESFPFFAVAVVAAMVFTTQTATLDVLAVVYLGFRILHALTYISDRPTLRSAMYAGAFFANIAIFVLPAFK